MTASTLHVLRVGHMGDVLLTEPIAAALRSDYGKVVLYTDFIEAGRLMPIYDEVRPFVDEADVEWTAGDRVLKLIYEIYPGINHLDGYARHAGVEVRHRVPKLRSGGPRYISGEYVLVAPDTSHWIQRMRRWRPERTIALGGRVGDYLGMSVIVLEDTYSFAEMVSLVEYCTVFVGNDSGPAILAQCFGRKAYITFGATSPERVLLSRSANAILHRVGCNGCKHFARHTDIECAVPLCLDDLTVEVAFAEVVRTYARTEASL